MLVLGDQWLGRTLVEDSGSRGNRALTIIEVTAGFVQRGFESTIWNNLLITFLLADMRAALAIGLAFALLATAHEHHDQLSEEQANAPVDAILWIHMTLQAGVWGILFPVGMILGLSRSRWHVPLQVFSFCS